MAETHPQSALYYPCSYKKTEHPSQAPFSERRLEKLNRSQLDTVRRGWPNRPSHVADGIGDRRTGMHLPVEQHIGPSWRSAYRLDRHLRHLPQQQFVPVVLRRPHPRPTARDVLEVGRKPSRGHFGSCAGPGLGPCACSGPGDGFFQSHQPCIQLQFRGLQFGGRRPLSASCSFSGQAACRGPR